MFLVFISLFKLVFSVTPRSEAVFKCIESISIILFLFFICCNC